MESGIINNRDSEFFERLRNGLINTTIDEGAQKQHYDIKAWKNQRKQAMAKYLLGQRDDKAIPTALLMQSLNPQELVNKYAGKGVLVWCGKNEYPNEFIQLDHPVGITFDKKKGHYIFTDVIEIRYTAKGTHIFPTIRRGGIFRV